MVCGRVDKVCGQFPEQWKELHAFGGVKQILRLGR